MNHPFPGRSLSSNEGAAIEAALCREELNFEDTDIWLSCGEFALNRELWNRCSVLDWFAPYAIQQILG
jgi:hypothetical protein